MAESARFPVILILTDKGSEFVNKEMTAWYASRRIEHVKSSGFPRSFWIYALLNAVFVKNRIYCKAIDGIPFQCMFGIMPDVHHIRPFGCLVEDTVGFLVYIPSENTVKFVAEVRVREDITYGDRHNVDHGERDAGEWLRLSTEPPEDEEDAVSTMTKVTSEDDYMDMADEQESEDDISASAAFETNMVVLDPVDDVQVDVDDEDEVDAEPDGVDADQREDDVSVSAHYGSDAGSMERDGFDARSEPSADDTVEGGGEPDTATSTHGPTAVDRDAGDTADEASANEASNNEASVDPRGMLISCDLPTWLHEFLGKNGKPINVKNLRVPKNRRAAMRSKYADFWRLAEQEEMQALKEKGVLEEIDGNTMPEGSQTVRTMWVYALKKDAHGYIIRFKARLVALGNWQRPGIDFKETFSPVARMSSFRDLVGISVVKGLRLYGGDINTTYLNASLEIQQYIQSIEGFPCNEPGHVYVVKKALYGLRQSGREWNTEINGWLLGRGFVRCATEPCLYFLIEGDMIEYLLVYVDDVVCATNNERFKCTLFADLDQEYGLKDEGF
ncbi:hypothetical protein ATCC90586_009233 [Pythium insidiosum]|nr:hypothetical protein ATCC90586_009233 [Pythium insidiosum]